MSAVEYHQIFIWWYTDENHKENQTLRSCVLKTIYLICCICFTSVVHSSDTFSVALQAELEKIKDKPRQIIDEYELIVKSGESTKSLLNNKEIFHLLSQAYYSLLMPDQALEYAKKALELVKSEPDSWWYHVILVDLSLAYELTGQAITAQKHAERAVAWAKKNDQFVLLQNALLAQGVNELTLGKYDDALNSFTTAFKMSTQYSDTLPAGNIAYYIALAHEYSNNNHDAIMFFEQASEYYKQTNQVINFSDALYGLARAYKMTGNYQKALTLFIQSLDISLSLDDLQGQAYTYKELSGVYLSQNNLESAHLSLVKSLKMFAVANNMYMLADVHKQLAEIAKSQHAIPHAINLTKIALSYAQGESFKPHYISLLALQGDLLALSNEYKQAFEASRLAFIEQQKYSKQSNEENYDRMRAEFNFIKSEDENRLLALENDKVIDKLQAKQQQSYLLIMMVIMLITISVAAVILYLQSKNAQIKLSSLANTDPLTKLANRRTAFDTLSVQIKLAKREKFELAIALIDLDLFKHINDKYGHPAGDQILVSFAYLATVMFRTTDTIARIGGEEFLLIFPYTSVNEAQDLIIEFTDKLRFDDSVTSVINEALTCSVGITDAAMFDSEQEAISIADKAMYRAKKLGRDAIVIDNENPSA